MMKITNNQKLLTLKTAALVLMITAASDLQLVYYHFIKIAACFLFALIAYVEYNEGLVLNAIIGAAGSIMFFPFYNSKAHLYKADWKSIDIVFAILIALSIALDLFRNKNLKQKS